MEKSYELINGTTIIPCKFKINGRAKRLRITVNDSGVTVVVPSFARETEVRRFIEENRNWILARVKELQAFQEQQLVQGDILYLRGRPYHLEIKLEENRKMGRKGIIVEDKQIIVYLPGEKSIVKPAVRKKLDGWYRELAREAIRSRIIFYSEKIGVAYNTVRIKDQKTRWGSCSTKKNLNFNWRLIMAPPEVLDYVVVHELCHLVHLDHSPGFWGLVQEQLPDYAQHRRWLKDRGAALMAF